MTTTYVGIDPGGRSGALATLNTAGTWHFYRMPDTLLDTMKLLSDLSINELSIPNNDIHFILELPSSYHKGGAGSIYANSAIASVNFALHCGRLEGILRTLQHMHQGISITIADPIVWIREIFPPLPDKPQTPSKPRKPKELRGVKPKDYKLMYIREDPVVMEYHAELCKWHRAIDEFKPMLNQWKLADKQYRRELIVQWIGTPVEETECWNKSRGKMKKNYGYEDAAGLVFWFKKKLEGEK